MFFIFVILRVLNINMKLIYMYYDCIFMIFDFFFVDIEVVFGGVNIFICWFFNDYGIVIIMMKIVFENL